jgi:hypothetical protein
MPAAAVSKDLMGMYHTHFSWPLVKYVQVKRIDLTSGAIVHSNVRHLHEPTMSSAEREAPRLYG